MPEHAHRRFRQVVGLDDLRTFRQQHRRVLRQQADELLAVRPVVFGTRERTLAQEVRLLLGNRPGHTEILRCHGRVGFLADDRVALFRAQDVHGFGAVRRDPVVRARRNQRLPQWQPIPGRYIDLICKFAGETDPAHARSNPRDLGVLPGHESERVVRHVQARGNRRQDVAGMRAHQGNRGPVLGDRGREDVQVRPFRLEPLLHPLQDLRRIAGRGRGDEPVFGDPDDRAVVDHHPVDAAHDAVADPAGLQVAHHVRVQHVEKRTGVRTLDVDLAQSGAVHHRDAIACGTAFALHGVVHALARLRVVPRTLPLAYVLEFGPMRDVPRVNRSDAHGIVQLAAVPSGQSGERHRRIGRAERRRPLRGKVDAECVGGDSGGEDAGRLALIVRGSDGGVALDVLKRAQPRTGRTEHIGNRGVALQVDESSVRIGLSARHQPERHRLRNITGRGAGDPHGRQLAVRNVRAQFRGIPQLAAGLAEQVHNRVPAARHQKQIALDTRAVVRTQRLDQRGADPRLAFGADNDRSGSNFDLPFRGGNSQVNGHRGPGVDDQGDRGPGVGEIESGLIRRVVRGEHDRPAPGQHPVAVQVRPRGPGEHDARPVVVTEHDRSLVRAGRKHSLLRANPPDPLAGDVRIGHTEVIRALLQREHEPVVVRPERRGALQHQHFRQAPQFAHDSRDPSTVQR